MSTKTRTHTETREVKYLVCDICKKEITETNYAICEMCGRDIHSNTDFRIDSECAGASATQPHLLLHSRHRINCRFKALSGEHP